MPAPFSRTMKPSPRRQAWAWEGTLKPPWTRRRRPTAAPLRFRDSFDHRWSRRHSLRLPRFAFPRPRESLRSLAICLAFEPRRALRAPARRTVRAARDIFRAAAAEQRATDYHFSLQKPQVLPRDRSLER